MDPTGLCPFARAAAVRRAHDGRVLSLSKGAAALLFVCAGAAAAPASGQSEEADPALSDVRQAGGPRIVRIEVGGSASLTEQAVLAQLSTRLGDNYDTATLENDLRRLFRSGRYRTVRWEGPERVDVGGVEAAVRRAHDGLVLSLSKGEAGVALRLVLEERPVLRKIEFVGNKKISTETLKAEIEGVGLFEGRRARYDEAAGHEAVVALKRLYREGAYFLAEITCRAEAYEGEGERGPPSVKLVFEIEENERAPLKGFRIVGNRAFTDREIRRVISQLLARQSGEGGGRDYNRLHFQRALDELQRQLYRGNGYLDAEVRLDHLELFTHRQTKQWLVAHIEITEGPVYKVGVVTLTLEPPGEGPPLEVTREELLEILSAPSGEFRKTHKPMKPGSVYSDTVKWQAVSRLETALGRHGRIDTKIRARDVFGEEGTKIDVDFVVRPSRPYRVRYAHVRGNHKTKPEVFTRELYYAGIRPEKRDPGTGQVERQGSLIDSRKVDLAERNIYATNLVKSEYDEKTGRPRYGVKITPRPLGNGLADLIIDVNENETGQLMMGFSMSSDGEVAGQVEFRQDNFNLFGLPRSWGDWTNAFMGAGQSFSLSAHFGTIRSVFRANFIEPYFMGLPLRFQLGFFDTESRLESYDKSQSGTDGSLGRVWSLHRYKRRRLRASIRWRDEAVGIDSDSSAPSWVKDEEGTARIRRAGLGLTFDSLDNWRRPREGMKLDISRDAAGGYLGGDKSFTKAEFDLRAHRKVARGRAGYPHVLNFRFRASYADPYYGDKSVPYYENYYAGGIYTLRGFRWRSVGPRDAGTGDPLGGNFRLLGTLEYTFPLETTDSIRGVLFLDAGNVWRDPSDFDAGDLRRSIGVGIEIFPAQLPFPISMYWSRAIGRKDGDETQVFQFAFGNIFTF